MKLPDQERLDQETNFAMEDSNAMTIEFLRARLLAERSVSRSARQRAEELGKKVAELEEQLKIVSLQRKKAEKATADVLAILENNGISDISEAYYSSSDQETPYDSKLGNGSAKKEENSVNSKVMKSELEELSGSDLDFSPITGRSLSWKGRKGSSHSLEKYKDPIMKRQSSFASIDSSSPKHRQGKSCRQIRRKESRSAVEERKIDSVKVSSQENGTAISSGSFPDHSGREDEMQNGCAEIEGERGCPQDRNVTHHDLVYDGYRGDQAMEKALAHQAQLIGQYEAMEKAQREWEEKFRENNSSTPDSCDPGNHSDVTEERYEMKAQALYLAGAAGPPADESKPKVVDMGSSQHQESRSNTATTSPSQDFAFPMAKETQKQPSLENNHLPPLNSEFDHPHTQISSENHSNNVNSSNAGNSLSKGEASGNHNERYALVLHKTHDELCGVLESLKQARLSLQQKMNEVPLIEGGPVQKASELSVPTMNKRERAEIPVGCAGLFRLPTDFLPEAKKSSLLGLGSQLSLPDYPHMDVALTTRDHYVASPYRGTRQSISSDNQLLAGDRFVTSPYRDTRSSISTNDQMVAGDQFFNSPYTDARSSLFTDDRRVMSPFLDAHSRIPSQMPYTNHDLDTLSSPSRYTITTHPSSPDPSRMPPNERYFAPHHGGAVTSPSPDHFSFYDDHIRPNMYR